MYKPQLEGKKRTEIFKNGIKQEKKGGRVRVENGGNDQAPRRSDKRGRLGGGGKGGERPLARRKGGTRAVVLPVVEM